MILSRIKNKIAKLPTSPGVYIFKNKTGGILYVGKATSLRDRVSSYFSLPPTPPQPSPEYRRGGQGNRPIEIMIAGVSDIEIKKTDTVLEAYILEQELIKKIQPKYNVDGKDDKSFSYVMVTKEEFPKFVIVRGSNLNPSAALPNPSPALPLVKGRGKSTRRERFVASKIYGPYTSKKQIEIALKILRKIFPYHNKFQKTEKGCLDYQIGLCPGPYDKAISKEDYAKNIRGIRMILEGKKKSLLAKLKKEMAGYAKEEEFEKAAAVRNKIFALQHVQDIALISDSQPLPSPPVSQPLRPDDYVGTPPLSTGEGKAGRTFRVEGYDISNISGQHAVGSMVVFDNTGIRTQDLASLQANKSEYRKFKIKTVQGANDVAMMEEVLLRRFKNNWPRPNLILLDGGAGHLNIARRVLRRLHLDIPILAVAKGPTRKKMDLRPFGTVPDLSENIITQIRDEAHRFAITYHRKLRRKGSLE